MKRYFVVALVGMVHLGLLLPAPAQDSVQTYVTDQGMIRPLPSDSKRPTDQGSGLLADDNKSDSLLNGHFVGGAGVYIMKPFFQNNPAFTSEKTPAFINNGPSVLELSGNQQHDFSWGLNPAPVIWLGFATDCGWGLRARWRLFDQRSTASAESAPNTSINSAELQGSFGITAPPPSFGLRSTQMFIDSNLKVNVLDFEATRETEAGVWFLLFSAGFRYAHLSQDYTAIDSPPFFGATIQRIVELLSSGHNFNGAGPTVAIEARRPIGSSGFALFANLRGTILFGQSKQQVDLHNITLFGLPSFQGPPPGPTPFTVEQLQTAQSDHDSVIPVAEMEMGAEFSRRWGNVYPFIRTGLVAQTWFDAGSASTLDGNLGFLGLSVTAGLNY